MFEALHWILLAELNSTGQIDWTRASVDASHMRAKKGRDDRPLVGRPPKTGSNHQLISDGST
ncbi:hypothetical protein ACFWA9_24725 [Kitasatospora sp. NPDC059973]|uniref:hypothetical protein n=1 Tax=Kitasatospora sp. NPDC059973 TaxID=3347020 RepID=UPI0036D12823